MHSIAETKTDLKTLLAKGLDQALKRLETALDPASPSFNTFVQIKARYSAYLSTVILGMVSQAELDQAYAQLCHAFLLTVDGLSASDLKTAEAPGAAEGPRRGELLYHIPRQMQEQREYRCAVRVAYLHALLHEGWEAHDDDEAKNIRVAEVMAVELRNHAEDEPFGIRTPTDTVQFLDPDDFTEWLFYVKPRRVGAFSLDLRVSVIEVRNGREVKKDVVLEQHVVVVTEAVEPAATAEFDRSGVLLNFNSTSETPPSPRITNYWFPHRPLRIAAFFLAFIMFGTTVTWAFTPAVTRDWWKATLQDNPEAYDAYIRTYKNGDRKYLEKAYYHKALKTDSLAHWRDYQRDFQQGEHRLEVLKAIEKLEYRMVQGLQTRPLAAAFTQYVRDFPDGAHFAEVIHLAETSDTTVAKTLMPLLAETALEALRRSPTLAATRNLLQQFPEKAASPTLRQFLNTHPDLEQQVMAELGLRLSPAANTVADLTNNMVRVKGGTFSMGSPEGDKDASSDEKPAHAVTLSDFFIGKYEVTQAQWRAVMGDNPSYFKGCDRCPVEQVSWDDVQNFIKKLNALDPGKNYRLPTEAEWEYAAKGGAAGIANGGGTKYAGGDNIAEVAWYDGNSGNKTHPVGGKKANALGLYDMSGNVYEWCSDWYGDYKVSGKPVLNPKGADKGDYRVNRGGSWGSTAQYCRVSNRDDRTPTYRSGTLGFRLVLQ